MKGGCVYMITNKNHTTLYTGVTADLKRRMIEHREQLNPNSFASRYNCHKLVFYQSFLSIEDAIAEEKRIKAGSRKQKLRLINEQNSEWKDLFFEI